MNHMSSGKTELVYYRSPDMLVFRYKGCLGMVLGLNIPSKSSNHMQAFILNGLIAFLK